jgi:predicted negative regulator of RcsB-dependent stress response
MEDSVEAFDRLLYRLVMTKDEQLEEAINQRLPGLLAALTTARDEAVRNKVSAQGSASFWMYH